MADQPGQGLAQIADDVELLAQRVKAIGDELDCRFDGVRTDFEVALLQQHGKFIRRFERLEALIAEKVTGDLAEELLAELYS